MGICLDTEQNNEELETTGGDRSRSDSVWAGRATPPAASFPMQNSSHVKFEPPNVPVIFILGGPGSGKVTHCDNLMQERRGVVHINMTDLLQQYAIGNDMQDFGTLSSKTVTEVLMLEMKMAPTAKTYLVSGYPRSMRDVAEYSDKIQTISGVVLVSWRQRVLERQIEYGARLGHVVLSLARMELANFYRNVMPVADYFDQSNMLVAVNGERNPEEVYKDFRAAVLQILGNHGDETTMHGVSGVGVGAGGIPGEIVGVEPAPAPDRDVKKERGDERVPDTTVFPVPAPVVVPVQHENGHLERIASPKPELIRVRTATVPSSTPPTVWVVGGPGSNKAALCQRAVARKEGWMHFSVGQRLRALADSGGPPGSEGASARAAVGAGELAAHALPARLVASAVAEAARAGLGLVLDGYPRDLEQMNHFQKQYGVAARMVLVDCSKLQLGRGRRDDAVAAFRRRLELFRELSLPMLKHLDQNHRLVIVDGDTDTAEVQEEFTRVLLEEMEKAEALAIMPSLPVSPPQTGMGAMQQLTHAVSRMGGALANGGPAANGRLPNGTANKVKPILNNVNKVSTVSALTQADVRRLYEHSTGEVLDTHM